MAGGKFFFVDAFNIYLAVLTAFVSMTTAIFSRRYMRREREHGRVGHVGMRFYHAMFQLFIFAMLLCLLTNNVGILWIAMELATLSTVLLVSLYRTPTAIEAAWKYFILCGVGIAQALFGTVLLYFAAEKVLGEGGDALLWTNLSRVSGSLEPTVLSLAFVFLMVGYGTKVGLVPLHNWLPDAHSEGPTPISAVLSGLLLNVALYALVRCKALVDGATRTHHAGDIMMGFGLLSILVSAFSLLRQKDIKRMFSYSSIEHMGIATFAFGLGGPIATFGALLHMLMHSLAKSSIFFTRRPRLADARHAGDGAHPRPVQGQPARRLGVHARGHGDHRPAPLRRLHERVPDPHRDHQGRARRGRPFCCWAWRWPSRRCSGACSRWSPERPPPGSSR